MKYLNVVLCIFFMVLCLSTAVRSQTLSGEAVSMGKADLIIRPILHGTIAMEWQNKIIYVDPNGGAKAFAGVGSPDLVLITDIHGDHYNSETLAALDLDSATIIVPQAVVDKMGELYADQRMVLGNGEMLEWEDIGVEAIPMYNLPEAPDSPHVKGRGNGYILTFNKKRVYISGDTEDIPEMRELKNIQIAFICMNLPYTMDVDRAASAVLEFKPKVVYPYHYRGSAGFSDVKYFQTLVNEENKNIEVRLRQWYPENE